MCENHGCDLCGLDVGIKPFYLESAGKRLQFCCDGCLGIYRMLHDDEAPAAPGDKTISQGEQA